jgi:hypothetical protein
MKIVLISLVLMVGGCSQKWVGYTVYTQDMNKVCHLEEVSSKKKFLVFSEQPKKEGDPCEDFRY